jgi:CheY-like chemotaxis protein
MKTILWVEDEKDQYEAFSYYLEKEYKIDRALDYEDALLKLNKTNYDLIIVDIIIPSGKKISTLEELKKVRNIFFGVELIQRIREMNKLNKILVVTVVKEGAIQARINAIDPNIQIINKYESGPENIMDIVTKMQV